MALSKKDALDAARAIISGPRVAEMPRLDRIAEAMRPDDPDRPRALRVEIPSDAPPIAMALARKSETNYMPLVVDTFGQVMKVDGYYTATSPELAGPWEWWQRNRMDARQTGLVRGALQYGASYAMAMPGVFGPQRTRGPRVSLHSPRAMTAVYQDPSQDEWPMMALLIDGNMVTLVDEEMRYRFGMENPLRAGMIPALSAVVSGGLMTFIDSAAHDQGVCPVVRYRDRMLLAGEEQYGIVEPLLTIQDRINETTFGLMVAQYFAAFKQRYVIGWVPKSEQEKLKASAATIWTFADSDVKIGAIEESDLKMWIDSKSSAVRDLAGIGQLSPQDFGDGGISNVSAETVDGLEQSKYRKTDEITTSLGESHEQLLRLCAQIAGDDASAEDYSSEVRWKDATARSFAQTVDGLGKLGQMLGVPQELLWEQIPGWTQNMVDRAKQIVRSGDSLASLASLLDAQAGDGGF